MNVQLRNPDNRIELPGERVVADVLKELEINPETVLVIYQDTLVMPNAVIPADGTIEIRPVISGGAA
ncbi:thiamine biosynthesis protein ThiS [Stomatohabitans albus]|uniref:thiamine biosynthesis protein ThiS n=1 Tax=Stomatohabitans albus TaxID=3110766 RepID=UPI00300D630E